MNKEIRRYRGDTYPVSVVLRGVTDWESSEIIMSWVFPGVSYRMVGTVVDQESGRVEFYPPDDAITSPRRGEYDVQVDDGRYVATYMRGRVMILEDVTR